MPLTDMQQVRRGLAVEQPSSLVIAFPYRVTSDAVCDDARVAKSPRVYPQSHLFFIDRWTASVRSHAGKSISTVEG